VISRRKLLKILGTSAALASVPLVSLLRSQREAEAGSYATFFS